MRVAFGEVWKESLTELSGGQRSLLALSLILAMLLFKPAPIYILDEVLLASSCMYPFALTDSQEGYAYMYTAVRAYLCMPHTPIHVSVLTCRNAL